MACGLSVLPATGGTYTWTGAAAKFSAAGAFSEGTPPADDSSVVLDFSGMSSPWTATCDIEGLQVNRIVFGTASGSFTGSAPLTLAANGAIGPTIDCRGNSEIRVPITLSADTTVTGTRATDLNFYSTISGSGKLLLTVDLAQANADQDRTAPIYRFRTANTFAGGLNLDRGIAWIYDAGAFGAGAAACTNNTVFQPTGTTSPMPSRFYLSGPLTITNTLYLGTEAAIGYSSRLSSSGSGTVTLDAPVYSVGGITKISADSAAATTRIKKGLFGTGDFILVPSQAPIYIEETPINIGENQLWSGSPNHPLYLNVAGCTFSRFCGYGAARIAFLQNGITDASHAFGGQANNAAGLVIDLNGTDQVLGGHVTAGSANCERSRMELKNSQATTSTVTVVHTNFALNSTLTISGPMNFVKAGAGTLSMTNDFSVSGTLTVSNGTLQVNKEPAAGLLARKIVVNGGILDLGGKTWQCGSFTMSSGSIRNGTLQVYDAACEITGGTIDAAISARLVTSGDAAVLGKVSETGRRIPATYDVPEGTVMYYPFDAEDSLLDFSGNGLDLNILAGAPSAGDGTTAIGGDGCAFFTTARNTCLGFAEMPDAFPKGGQSFSVSVWVKVDPAVMATTAVNSEYGVFAIGDPDLGVCDSVAIKRETSGWRVHNYFFSTVSGMPSASYPGVDYESITNGVWHHIVTTFDKDLASNDYKIYVDGERRNQATIKDRFQAITNGHLWIGNSKSTQRFTGWLDEFLVFDRALSADEVSNLYTHQISRVAGSRADPEVSVSAGSTLTAAAADLICCYHFDSADELAQDAAGNAPLSVTNGNPAFAANVSPYGTGGALYCNGSSWLKATAPAFGPRGKAPFTMGCYLKFDTSLASTYCDANRETGWIHYGASGTYNGISHSSLKGGCLDNTDVKINFYWNNFNQYGTMTKLADGNWHFVATVWDGWVRKTYLDGNVFDTKTTSADLDLIPTQIHVGKAMNGGGFTGWIDEAAVFGKALQEDELAVWRTTGLYAITNTMLPTNTVLDLAADATLSLVGYTETLDRLATAGTFTVKDLIVRDTFAFTGTLNGNLTLADGVTVCLGTTAPVVNGTLTVAGNGTFSFAAAPSFPCSLTVATGLEGMDATSLAHLATWAVTWPTGGLSDHDVRKPILQDGTLTLYLARSGLTILFR